MFGPGLTGSLTAAFNEPTAAATGRHALDADPAEHEGFPRLVRAADGRLLLFTRLGTTHAGDAGRIMFRVSRNDGVSWSPRREIRRDPAGWSAHNPVAVVAADGTVILWCSRYDWEDNRRNHCVLSRSPDHGDTWEPFRQFDLSPGRTCYYVTDAICAGGRLLAGAVCFAPTAREPAWNVIWGSDDHGVSWREVGLLTRPEANIGDEVGLAHLGGDRVLLLLRGRRRPGLYRYRSADFGATWTTEEYIGAQVGTLQRPFLTHLGGRQWLLTGRQSEARPLAVVAYVSTDDGETFTGRTTLDTYQADGGYTSTVVKRDGSVLLAYYADPEVANKPSIYLAAIRLGGPGKR